MCERGFLDPPVLAFSLLQHRHLFLCIPLSSRFICYNKPQILLEIIKSIQRVILEGKKTLLLYLLERRILTHTLGGEGEGRVQGRGKGKKWFVVSSFNS
jgi:hypothetical protein